MVTDDVAIVVAGYCYSACKRLEYLELILELQDKNSY